MTVNTDFGYFFIVVAVFSASFGAIYAEAPINNVIDKKVDVTNDGKLKRQNGGGEEVDLSTVSVGNQGGQPGQAGGIPQQPNVPGGLPFFGNGGGPFFQQQPFFGNGLGFPGAFPQGFPQNGFPQNGFPQNGFPQNGFPQNGFSQNGLPQGAFPGSNVILQNNGKQYLVQPLTANQRVVQKNGKQYLLQPLTANSAALLGGVPAFNVPNAALSGLNLGQNGALNALAGIPGAGGGFAFPGAATGGNAALSQGFSPALAAVQPSALSPANGKLTSSVPQRFLVGNPGERFEVEQIPIRNGQPASYLGNAVGGVAAQLAAQATGQQYAQQYAPFGAGGLSQAYSRANEAGYGSYATGRSLDLSDVGGENKKRNTEEKTKTDV